MDMHVAEFNTDLDRRLRLAAELSTDEGVAKLHAWVNEILVSSTGTRFSGPFGHELELIWEVHPAPEGFKTPRNVFFAIPNAMPDEPRNFKLGIF